MVPRERRVVVALDATSAGPATAAAAVDLAVALRGTLSGLFVEDADLLRAAMLPFSRLVHDTGQSRAIDAESVEAAQRVAVARAKRELERAAALAHLTCSFRVERGALLATLQAEVKDRDLVLVGSASRARVRPGTPAAPLAVVLGEPRPDHALLDVVELMVRAQGGPVRVFRRAALPDLAAVAGRVAAARPRALLVDLSDPWISEAALRSLRRRLGCPIILVR